MIRKTLAQIADMSKAVLIQGDPDAEIQGVFIDSRTIEEGGLYVPLLGARADGHNFIEQVKKAGAGASFWQKDRKPYPKGIPLLLVQDPLYAMQKLAQSYLKELHPYTIGITGSNGKTSTKDMCASIFSRAMKTQKTQGNHNNEIGLPLTILEFDEDIEAAILEMGMEQPGDIDFLVQMAELDAAIIVSIGSAHMENFGDRMGIARHKLEITDGLKPDGTFIWNCDSPELSAAIREITLPETLKTRSFGANGDLQIISDIQYVPEGIQFEASGFENPLIVHALGDYQASNALAAILAAMSAGISNEQIEEGLRNLELTKMRGALLNIKKASIIDDTYKSNPESAMSAIDTLMKIPARKHIAVLADMLDLGEKSRDLHKQVGAYAKDAGVDSLYAYGERSEDTAEAFGSRVFESKEDIEKQLIPLLEEDVAVLIKGSRAMNMDSIVNTLLKENKK